MIDFDQPINETISDILRETCLSFGIFFFIEHDPVGDRFDTHWIVKFWYKEKSKEVPLYIDDSITCRDAATIESRVLSSVNQAMYFILSNEGRGD